MRKLSKREKYYLDLFQRYKNSENMDSLFKVYSKPSDEKIRIFNNIVYSNSTNSIKRVRILKHNIQMFTFAIEFKTGDLAIYTPKRTYYIENYKERYENE